VNPTAERGPENVPSVRPTASRIFPEHSFEQLRETFHSAPLAGQSSGILRNASESAVRSTVRCARELQMKSSSSSSTSTVEAAVATGAQSSDATRIAEAAFRGVCMAIPLEKVSPTSDRHIDLERGAVVRGRGAGHQGGPGAATGASLTIALELTAEGKVEVDAALELTIHQEVARQGPGEGAVRDVAKAQVECRLRVRIGVVGDGDPELVGVLVHHHRAVGVVLEQDEEPHAVVGGCALIHLAAVRDEPGLIAFRGLGRDVGTACLVEALKAQRQ